MARFASTQSSTTGAINTLADAVNVNVAAATSNAAASPLQMTAAMALSGLFIQTTSGAFTVYLPTPATLVAAMPNAQVGSQFVLWVRNDGDNTLTLSTNSVTGLTLSGTATIATTLGQCLLFKLTNVTSGSEAYTAYVTMKVAN